MKNKYYKIDLSSRPRTILNADRHTREHIKKKTKRKRLKEKYDNQVNGKIRCM
jgi:hypothetical protein